MSAGAGSSWVGGLAGIVALGLNASGLPGPASQLTTVYATGGVTAASGSSDVGGLIGLNAGTTRRPGRADWSVRPAVPPWADLSV